MLDILASLPVTLGGSFADVFKTVIGVLLSLAGLGLTVMGGIALSDGSKKGGVMLLMKSVAQEVAPLKIRVNSICPGAIRTPINRPAWETPQAYNDLMRLVPYKRIGEPEDIAKAAVWLASDESDYITGANIPVNGGLFMSF